MRPAAALKAANGRAAIWGAAALLAWLGGCAPAGQSSPSPIFMAAQDGYLEAAALDDLARATPEAPAPGSPQDRADRLASARLQALEDSDRWLMATAHAEVRPPLALQHFDCALGVRLGSAPTPILDRMAARAFHDVQAAAVLARAGRLRSRPVADDPARRACQTLTPEARRSSAYPSSVAAAGAAYAEILARVAPDRAEAVRRIGHEIGVSRLVCAMAYPSDVAAAEALGRAVAAQIAATPAFQTDVAAARAEIEAARATGRTNPGCAAERAALATPLP